LSATRLPSWPATRPSQSLPSASVSSAISGASALIPVSSSGLQPLAFNIQPAVVHDSHSGTNPPARIAFLFNRFREPISQRLYFYDLAGMGGGTPSDGVPPRTQRLCVIHASLLPLL